MSLDQSMLSPAKEHAIMRTAFDLFDGNGDGRIDIIEFGSVIRALGFNATNEQILEAFKQYDKNEDGGIDFDEFVTMLRFFAGCSRDKLEENLRQAFRVFDRNCDGYISADELRYVLTSMGEKLTPAEAEELIAMIDQDGDGRLMYEEFVVLAKKSMSECIKSLSQRGENSVVIP